MINVEESKTQVVMDVAGDDLCDLDISDVLVMRKRAAEKDDGYLNNWVIPNN